MHD
jgi:hypothetical protein